MSLRLAVVLDISSDYGQDVFVNVAKAGFDVMMATGSDDNCKAMYKPASEALTEHECLVFDGVFLAVSKRYAITNEFDGLIRLSLKDKTYGVVINLICLKQKLNSRSKIKRILKIRDMAPSFEANTIIAGDFGIFDGSEDMLELHKIALIENHDLKMYGDYSHCTPMTRQGTTTVEDIKHNARVFHAMTNMIVKESCLHIIESKSEIASYLIDYE